jgi:hypothetical protein
MSSIESLRLNVPRTPSVVAVRLTRHLRRALRADVRLGAAVLASVLLLPYTLVPQYAYHAPVPFSGPTLINPYDGMGSTWKRANFHAHSQAWGGLTSGHGSAADVRTAYRAAGYDVAAVSNYHQIDRGTNTPGSLPVYEHGYSIRKTHQLVLGARTVTALDFPLWQTTAAKQFLLERLRDPATLIAIAHPYLRNGYGQGELAALSGYDLLEIRSHWNDASAWWDSVLTAGNPVYAIGNDDSHDVSKPHEVGVVWTMVNADDVTTPAILAALRRGRMYVVAGRPNATPAVLQSLTVRGDTITAIFDKVLDSIRVVTDGGTVRSTAHRTARVTYAMTDADHYARIITMDQSGTLYLNPVIRGNGASSPRAVPSRRPLASAITRTGTLALWLSILVWMYAVPLTRWWQRRTAWVTDVPRVAPLSRLAAALIVLLVCLVVPLSLHAQAPRALPFKVGEYHEYDLKFGVITVGSGSLSVTGPDTLRGREVLRLRYEIRGGIPFFRVHDVMESWFDPIAMSSLRFTQDLNEGPKHYDRHFDFFPDEQIVLERGKPRAATVSAPLDDASFIYFVRSLQFETGQTQSFTRYFRPSANPVTIQVLRRETISVPAGTFNTIVIKPIIRTSGIFSEGGQAELWFSDDASHTLVQMKAKLSFGSLSLYLRPPRNTR